jgi:hypothetical protein
MSSFVLAAFSARTKSFTGPKMGLGSLSASMRSWDITGSSVTGVEIPRSATKSS